MQDILKTIQARQSARVLFDPERPIARKDLKKILEAARWAPTAHNMQNFEIIVVDDRKILESLSNIRHEIDDTFIRENYRQLSFSEEELKTKKVGILGTMFPPSWRTPGVKPDPHEERAHSFLGGPVQKSAVLLIVLYNPSKRAPASEGDFLGIMSLGCVMENMWLMAESLGIGFQILSALSADSIEKEVKRLLRIPADLKIAFASRLGYPISSHNYLRVRRELEGFTHHNRFGNKDLEGK
jgi:nitroreductase